MLAGKYRLTVRILLLLAVLGTLGGLAYFLLKAPPPDLRIKRVEEPLHEEGKVNVLGLSVTSGENELIFKSPVYEAKMQFNAIALNWKETGISWNEGRRVFLKTSLDGENWTDWLELESLGPLRDDDPRAGRMYPEVPLLVDGKLFQYQVVIRQDKGANLSPNLSDVWVTYIDSRTPLRQRLIGKIKELLSPAQAASGGPAIVSRAGWGSPDPNGNFFKGTSQFWDPSYYPVTQIFLHHTVFYDTSDPASSIRAIWEYHTYTRGWGDIGYNYLIDQNGAVYEGRFGGDNVVGGHVFSYNQKSLGVAVLGCFETASSSCTGAPPPSAAMLNSLTTFLAWKATNYEINPNTLQNFCGSSSCLELWTISGHRDANPTACPGNLLYDQLQTIREQTWNKKNAWDYSAKQVDYEIIMFSNYSTDLAVTLRFKNTGTATWSNTTNRLLLKVANPDSRTSIFQGTGWVDAQTPAILNEASVAPGATGSFTFNLKSPANVHGYYYENFRLAAEGSSDFSQFFGLIVLPPYYRWEFQGVSHSTGSVYMNPGETQTITLWAKNVGTATWYRDSSWNVRLGTWKPSRASSFYHASWFSNIRPALLNQASVAPGATGSFTFEVAAPVTAPGWYFERFNLVAEGLVWFNDPGAGAYFYVNPSNYDWEFQSIGHSTNSVYMNPGETQTITFKAKNSGTATWYRDSSWKVRLGTWRASRESIFYHGSWLNKARPAQLLEESVAPGAVGTFSFTVFVPAKASPGWYFERLNLVAEGLVWFDDQNTGFYLNVLPGYRWEFMGVSHSTGSVYMNPGETQTITLLAKNTGTTTWYRDSSWNVRLGTWKPSRASSFYHASWFGNIRPALLTQSSVAPGEVGTFTFTVTAPATSGWHFERFNLVAEGLIWLNDTGAGAYFYVNP